MHCHKALQAVFRQKREEGSKVCEVVGVVLAITSVFDSFPGNGDPYCSVQTYVSVAQLSSTERT
jgi:hypothetical protein